MKALEQAAAEQFGHDITLLAYLYANDVLSIKEMTAGVNKARILFIGNMSRARMGGETDGET